MKARSFVMPRRSFSTAIVGSSTLFREGLAQILDRAGFRIVASRPRVADLPHDSRSLRMLLLIIDAGDDPDRAIRDIGLFKGYQPAAHVVVIADRVKLDQAMSAFRVGANAYFLKDSTGDTFIRFLDLVMRGETMFLAGLLPSTADFQDEQEDNAPAINEKRIPENSVLLLDSDNTRTPELTAREKCILRCLMLGDSNKAIGRKIDIAEATVKVHVKAILRKIRAQNRTQAAIWAVNNASCVWIGASAAQARIPALLEGQKLGKFRGRAIE
jgi:DNA-binding NarL/FixJ family response regulator